MLKHKCENIILQQSKFKTVNIFDFDIVWCSVIEGNVGVSKFIVLIHDFAFKSTIFL